MNTNVYDYLAAETFRPPEGFDSRKDGGIYGALTEVEYFSKTTGATRKCFVYTPYGYHERISYPILYLLHGIGGTHTEWLNGAPNEILSNLIALGETPPMITVIPNVRAMKDDSVPSNIFGQENIDAFDNFINDLRNDLMPFIKKNYSISERREGCAIAGLSMGGRESLFIGLSLPDVFGYIGAFSPAPGLLPSTGSPPGSDKSFPGQFSPKEMTLPDKYKDNTFILICSGNQENMVGNIPFIYHKALEDNGIRHTYYTIDGGHDFGVWKNGLYYFAKYIFSQQENKA